eukprot:733609-Prymnesium_polylepis.1
MWARWWRTLAWSVDEIPRGSCPWGLMTLCAGQQPPASTRDPRTGHDRGPFGFAACCKQKLRTSHHAPVPTSHGSARFLCVVLVATEPG